MSTPNDLTTLAVTKQWLGVTSDTDDSLIAGLVSAVSQAVLADLGRPSLLPASYIEVFDGAAETALTLRHWPVTDVMSVTVDGRPVAASAGSSQCGCILEAADAVPPGAPQRIVYREGRFASGQQNVSVTYRAGYEITGEAALVPATAPFTLTAAMPFGAWAMDTGVAGASGPYIVDGGVYTFQPAAAGQAVTLNYGFIPNDIAQAACEWAADRYAARSRIGQSAKTLGGQETTSFIVKAMPDVVDHLLRPYRRVVR